MVVIRIPKYSNRSIFYRDDDRLVSALLSAVYMRVCFEIALGSSEVMDTGVICMYMILVAIVGGSMVHRYGDENLCLEQLEICKGKAPQKRNSVP